MNTGDRVKAVRRMALNLPPERVYIKAGHGGTVADTNQFVRSMGMRCIDWDGIEGPHFICKEDIEPAS